MSGNNLSRWLCAAVAFAFAGCTTCGAVEECDNTFIAFESPKDGETVSAPLDVVVTVVDRGGNPVELAAATVATRLSSSTEFSVPAAGALETGKATFGAVPMAAGDNLLRVSVQKANSQCSPVSKTIAVTVQDSSAPPEVTAFNFQGDGNQDKVLNSAELPSNPTAINAQLTVARAVGCRVSIKQGATEYGAQDITAQQVTVAMASSKFSNLTKASYPMFAEIICPDGRRNDAVGNPVASAILGIDREAPTCAIVSPSKTLFGPSDDDDPGTAGYQVRALGQAGGDATQMELSLTGGAAPQTTGPQSAAGGTLSKDFLIAAAGTVTYSVVLDVYDAAGNLCRVARQVTADFEAPGVTVNQPTAGAQSSYNLPVSIAVTGGDGSTVTVTTTPSGGAAQAVCGGTVVAGAFSCTGSFAAGAQTVTVTVTDPAGNTTTRTVNITVTAPGCAIAFTTPATNPALLTPRNDLQTGVPDLQYQFVATSPTAGCGSKVTRLLRNGTLVDTGTTDGSGVYRSPNRTEPDSGGAMVTYRVEIDDGVGNTTSATVGVVVNLNVPVVTVPVTGTNLNTERDLDNATPGVQAQLVYAPAPPAGYKGVLCSSVQFASGAVCPDGSGGFIVPGGDGIPAANAAFTYPDGSYTIRVVFKEIAGTQTVSDSTATTAISVESVRPAVTAFTYQNDANGDRRLNAAEQGSGNPVAVFAISNGNGGTVVVRNRTDNQIVSAAPAAITGSAASVALSGLGASTASFEGEFPDLVAEVTTALGSKNMVQTPPPTGATVNTVAFSSLRVDRVAPGCSLTSPNVPQLGLADDADGAASGYQVRVAGSTPADVGAGGALLELVPSGGAAQTQTATPSSGVAAHNFTVPSSGETDYEARCTATDQSGNVGTRATRAVRVDLVAPTCTLVAPNAGASPYTASYSISTQVTVTGGNGLIPAVYSRVGAGAESQVGQLPAVATGTSTGNVTYPSGTQTVRVEVVDPAGNACTGASTQQVITVNVPGCSLTWTAPVGNPARLLWVDDAAPASPTTVEYTLTGTSGCANQQIRFYRGSVGAGNELAGSPSTTNGSGAFSFPISLPDSDGVTAETIIAEMNNGNLTSFPLTVYVDLTRPVVTQVTPSGANLNFVSPSNSQLGLPSYVVDTNTGSPGANYTVSVTVTGAVGGTLSVRYQGSEIAGPATISGTTPTLDVVLPHNTTGTLITRVIDASGNIVDTTSSAAVDVIAPAAPTVTCTLVAGQERAARVNASWAGSTTYDDGTDSGSGAVDRFDVRWTSELVTPGGLASSAAFFDSNRASQDALVTPPATSREIVVPPLVSTYCYVRARDELFNYSPFPTSLPSAVANPGTRYTLANPHPSASSGQGFGRVQAARGSVNNDGLDDLIVGFSQSSGSPLPEAAFVYYGSADGGFATQTPQQLSAPDAVTGAFGFDVSMGNAADLTAGEGKSDVLVAAPLASTSAGRAYLFFGSATASQLSTAAGNYVVFLGPVAGATMGVSAQIVGDINADGVGEVVLTAPSVDGNRGRVYLFYGRLISQWITLAAGAPIPMTAADRVFLGPTPLVSATNHFGRVRGGFTTIGADLAIPNSQTLISSVFLFQGSTINAGDAGTPFTTGSTGAPNQAFQTFVGTIGGSGTREGFGTRVQSNLDGIGNANIDMMISEPYFKRVHLFGDRTSGSFLTTPTTTINGPATSAFFGWDAVWVDFSGDGRPDLFVGDFGAGLPTFYLHNRGVAGSEFDVNPAAAGSFWYSRLNGSRMGVSMVAGDFNADSRPDVAIADDTDGTGRVFVWH